MAPPARASFLYKFAGALLLGALVVLWTVRSMVPNIVAAGRRTSEEAAVSRLRELLWAEDRMRESGAMDRDGDGRGEFAFLGELMGEGRAPIAQPPLQPGRFRAVPGPGRPGVYRGEGYGFVVYLPAAGGGAAVEGSAAAIDAASARDRFAAYAFPIEGPGAGRRLFYIDQDERICETTIPDGAGDAARKDPTLAGIPPWNAALPPGARTLGAISECGAGDDGRLWRPWRHKKTRPPRPPSAP